jgi:hypothetical protein
VTSSELAKEVFSIVEAKIHDRPSPTEFEMAYQTRIAIERIRFAIKVTGRVCVDSVEGQEAGLQLLDALDRLEWIDRRFQDRSRRDGRADFRHR